MRSTTIILYLCLAASTCGCSLFATSKVTPAESDALRTVNQEQVAGAPDVTTTTITVDPVRYPVARPLHEEPAPGPAAPVAAEPPDSPALDTPVIMYLGDRKVQAPGGSRVSVTIGESKSRVLASLAQTDKSHGKGLGVRTSASSVLATMKFDPPEARLGDLAGTTATESTGGGGSVGLKALTDAGGGWVLYGLGAAAILAGLVVAIWLKQVGLGVALAAGGFLLIATATLFDRYPWVVWILVGGGVCLLAWFIFIGRKSAVVSDTLNAVVAGVEKAGVAAQPVKDAIAAAAGTQLVKVKAVVGKVKAKLGLT